jgi:hypothetical protein
LGGDVQPVTVIARQKAIARNRTMTRMVCLPPSSVRLNGIFIWLPGTDRSYTCALVVRRAARLLSS